MCKIYVLKFNSHENILMYKFFIMARQPEKAKGL